MAKTSFAELVRGMDRMASGIINHETETSEAGLTATKATELRTLITTMEVIENEQEKLKGDLKTKTIELNAQAAVARKKLADARKRVKLSVPQERWVEFGISDSK